jgi:hypothetical protein
MGIRHIGAEESFIVKENDASNVISDLRETSEACECSFSYKTIQR